MIDGELRDPFSPQAAQDFADHELTYPYWDPFGLSWDVLEFQYEAGRKVAKNALEKSIKV